VLAGTVLAGEGRPGPDPGQQASREQEKTGQSQPSGEPRRPAHRTDQEVLQVTAGLLGPHRGDLAGRDQRDQEREDEERETEPVRHERAVPAEPSDRLLDPLRAGGVPGGGFGRGPDEHGEGRDGEQPAQGDRPHQAHGQAPGAAQQGQMRL
jgi:hypothetical protein